MTKKKTGIFDPWRQEAPPPPEPIHAQDLEAQLDAVSAGTTPTRFAARRAGLVVWLPEVDRAQTVEQAKTNILAALEKLLADPSLASIFQRWRITPDGTLGPGVSKISSGARHVWVGGDYEDAIEAIAFAFREASRAKPSVETYLISLGIRPYVR